MASSIGIDMCPDDCDSLQKLDFSKPLLLCEFIFAPASVIRYQLNVSSQIIDQKEVMADKPRQVSALIGMFTKC